MLTPELVQQISQLLAEDRLSQRGIARVTGVGRGTVAAIASGNWPGYETRRQVDEAEEPEDDQPPERCPRCGGWVVMPCRRCRTEQSIREGRTTRLPPQPDEDVALQLRDKHRQRYQRVRARLLARLRRGELR